MSMTYVTRKFVMWMRPHGGQKVVEIPVTVPAAEMMRKVEACGFSYSIERLSDEMFALYISDDELEQDFGTYIINSNGNECAMRDALSTRICDADADMLDQRRGYYIAAQIEEHGSV